MKKIVASHHVLTGGASPRSPYSGSGNPYGHLPDAASTYKEALGISKNHADEFEKRLCAPAQSEQGELLIRPNADPLLLLRLRSLIAFERGSCTGESLQSLRRGAEGKASRNGTNWPAGGARTKSRASRGASAIVLDHTDLQGLQ